MPELAGNDKITILISLMAPQLLQTLAKITDPSYMWACLDMAPGVASFKSMGCSYLSGGEMGRNGVSGEHTTNGFKPKRNCDSTMSWVDAKLCYHKTSENTLKLLHSSMTMCYLQTVNYLIRWRGGVQHF